jgi:hypothetical protein
MAPDKKKSADKIDDMVALLMGIGVMPDMSDDLLFDQYLRNAISQ